MVNYVCLKYTTKLLHIIVVSDMTSSQSFREIREKGQKLICHRVSETPYQTSAVDIHFRSSDFLSVSFRVKWESWSLYHIKWPPFISQMGMLNQSCKNQLLYVKFKSKIWCLEKDLVQHRNKQHKQQTFSYYIHWQQTYSN